MTDDVQAIAAAPPATATTRSFESRSERVFVVIAAFVGIVGLVVLLGSGSSVTAPVWIGLALTVVFTVAIYGIEARGLAGGRPWAIAAALPLLWILILSDLYNLLSGLGQSRFNIPVGTILGIWALRGPRTITPVPRLGAAGLALVAADLAVSLATYTVPPILGPGGYLDAARSDIRQELLIDCRAGEPAPETLTITYRWSWTRDALLRSGDDAIVVRWFGGGADGDAYWHSFEDPPEPVPGVDADTLGELSGPLAQEWAGGSPNSATWAVDLAERGFAPGEVRLVLRRIEGSPPPPEPFTVDARYFHAGAWRSGQVFAQCDWH